MHNGTNELPMSITINVIKSLTEKLWITEKGGSGCVII